MAMKKTGKRTKLGLYYCLLILAERTSIEKKQFNTGTKVDKEESPTEKKKKNVAVSYPWRFYHKNFTL